MSRKNILDNIRSVIKVLEVNEESIKSLSYKIKAHWETTLKALEFLKEVGIVKERIKEGTKRKTRLFSLTKTVP